MKRFTRFIVPALIGIVLAIIVSVFLFQNRGDRGAINKKVDDVTFNFVRWETEAFFQKITMWLTGAENYVPADTHPDLVRDYITAIGDTKRLERELNNIYASSDDPADESERVQEELTAVRTQLHNLQPLAEDILQNQVGDILEQEGFSRLLPPIQIHITPLPQMLIISPRDEIQQLYAFPLEHGLTAPEKEVIEQSVFDENDFSALVEPIGGLAVYPTMIVETTNLNFIANTIAHEWTHIWLIPRPLGYKYALDPDIRTANETTASIFGDEIGAMVIETYYPEHVPQEREIETGDREQEPPAFDFRAEMRETRVEVDRLLAGGEIEAAEAYMEQRRQQFVENGYNIRKLNQAYFAFYGAYADGDGGGAAGANPIGENVMQVRQRSNSLRQFLRTMSRIRNAGDLEAIVRP